MFGISTFAQTTFAGLGVNAYSLLITEDSGLADSSTQLSTYLTSITENVVMNNGDAEQNNYYNSLSENIGIADLSTQASTFLQSLSENSSVYDSSIIGLAFALSEAITMADANIVYFAAQQSDTQNVNMGDSNTQQFNFKKTRWQPNNKGR